MMKNMVKLERKSSSAIAVCFREEFKISNHKRTIEKANDPLHVFEGTWCLKISRLNVFALIEALHGARLTK